MPFTKKYVESFFDRMNLDLEEGRKTMDSIRGRVRYLKNKLKKDKASQFYEIDELHLVTIAMCEEIQMRAMVDLALSGVMVYVDKEKKVRQKSQSVSTIFQMSRMLNDTSKKLGLSALDRKELKIESETDDGFKH